MRLLSRGIRKKARGLGIRYAFLFMRAQGQQLSEISSLMESGVIRPVVDKVFPFEKTTDALSYVETGRAKGKVVITVADLRVPADAGRRFQRKMVAAPCDRGRGFPTMLGTVAI